MIDWLIDWLMDWWIDGLLDWWIDGLIYWLIDCPGVPEGKNYESLKSHSSTVSHGSTGSKVSTASSLSGTLRECPVVFSLISEFFLSRKPVSVSKDDNEDDISNVRYIINFYSEYLFLWLAKQVCTMHIAYLSRYIVLYVVYSSSQKYVPTSYNCKLIHSL